MTTRFVRCLNTLGSLDETKDLFDRGKKNETTRFNGANIHRVELSRAGEVFFWGMDESSEQQGVADMMKTQIARFHQKPLANAKKFLFNTFTTALGEGGGALSPQHNSHYHTEALSSVISY